MKGYFFVFSLCMVFFLHGCGESLTDSRYALEFPQIPQDWEVLLGSPYWQVEWLNDQGQKEAEIVRDGAHIEVVLPQNFASAVLARPFWPEKGLSSGLFRPAGAIFPFDRSGKSLVLSWQGGVDANLFWELARAYNGAGEDSPPEEAPPEVVSAAARAVSRVPWNFNWPRFRELFADPTLNADIRADPWLADWRTIAEKIVQSGFDKRRLVPEARSNLPIPVGPGPWVGTSPFAAPLLFEDEPVFPVRQSADTWVSSEGILRCSSATWILISE